MNRRVIARLAGVLLAAIWIAAAPAQAQTPSQATLAAAGKIAQMLPGTSYAFTKHNETVWSTNLTRSNVGDVKVILSCNEDLLVVFIVLARKANIQKTPQFLEAIARANHEYDLTKILIDNDGDLGVRVDLHVRILDSAEVKTAINQVADVSNEWYPKVSAYVKR
jgi:hypothetical protein